MQGVEAGRWGKWRAARKVSAVLALIALLLAPLLNAGSHGPADYLDGVMAMAEDLAHGHSHDSDSDSGSHNAIDHDHPSVALIPQFGEAALQAAPAALFSSPGLASGLSRDGPRRPPRLSA